MLLNYDIRVIGAANVDKALAGIEARIRQHNQRVVHSLGVTPAQARRAASPGTAQIDQRRFQAASSAHFTSIARKQESADKAAGKAKEKALREEHRIRNQINNMNLRQIKTEEQERVRGLSHEHRVRERMAHARSNFLTQSVGRGFDRATNTVRTVGTAGAAMLGVGGAALAASAVSDATKLDETTRRLVIQGTMPGEKSKHDPDELRKKFEQTGIETGIAPQAVAEGVAQFVTKVGDLDTAVANMKVFATVAQATGASVQEIASSSADLSEKLGIKDVNDMSKALAMLTVQGKKGAFELRDLAAYLPEVSAAASTFGVKGVKGTVQLGGMMQIARRATGSGAEAATSVEAMFRQMVAKSGDIQSGDAFGGRKVSIFQGNDPTKPLRDFYDIIGDMLEASRGNVEELGKTFDVRGVRAVNPLITTFREASDKAGGGDKGAKAGRAAVMAALKDASEVKAEFSDIEKDAQAAMKSFSIQLDIIGASMKRDVGAVLLPELIRLAPTVAALVPAVGHAAKLFVDLVKFLTEHPFQALAVVIAAQLAADFTKAKLGDLVGKLITRAIAGKTAPSLLGGGGGGGTPVPGPGFLGSPGRAGIANAASTGTALGLSVATAIFTVGVANFEAGEVNMKRSGDLLNQVRAMGGAEDAGKARELVEQQRKTTDSARQGGIVSTLFGRGVAEFIGLEQAAELKTQETILKEMEERLQKLDSLNDMSQKMKDAGTKQEDAAAQLSEAAKRLGLVATLNRGNAPSPIK